MYKYVKSAKKVDYVGPYDDAVIRYTVTGFKNPNEVATIHREEEFKTFRNAFKYASSIADSFYQVVIREDEITLRYDDTEVSSSGPIVIFTNGVPAIDDGIRGEYRNKIVNMVRPYIDAYMKANGKSEWDGNLTMDTSIKDYYSNTYPDDDLAYDMNDATFEDVWNALNNGEDVYQVIGVGDSVIREQIFKALSKLQNVSYDRIYNMWLRGY